MSSHSDSEIKLEQESHKSKRYFKVKRTTKFKWKPESELPEYVQKYIVSNRSQAKEQTLLTAVSLNNVDRVQELLEEGTDPNCSDVQLRAPLHLASSKGYTQIVHLLLKYGAYPNQHDIVMNTPLHLAACTSNIKIITLLINYGADVKAMDLHGRSPLQLAKSKLEILKKSWREGSIEVMEMKRQLQEIVDLMFTLFRRTRNYAIVPQSENVDDLQMMNLSINQAPEEVDNQMARLELELAQFKI